MLDQHIQNIVKRITYKPDVVIGAQKNYFDNQYTIHLVAQVLDACASEPTKTSLHLRYAFYVPEDFGSVEKAVIEAVKEAVRRLEMHEVEEWLKIDGECIDDPHPEIPKLKLKPITPLLKPARTQYDEINDWVVDLFRKRYVDEMSFARIAAEEMLNTKSQLWKFYNFLNE